MTTRRPAFLVCPDCHGNLRSAGRAVACSGCGATWSRNAQGFLDLRTTAGGDATAGGAGESSARLEAYADHQEGSAERRVREYLLPWVRSAGAERVLDAGCGTGAVAAALTGSGLDAYGVDLPKAVPFWERAGRDSGRFFVGDATRLPFSQGAFKAVLSMGVIEHVGTTTGHCTLAPDHAHRRAAYARELVRVTGSGGRILVSCPNKAFPIDLHHGPGDAATTPGAARAWVARNLGVNVHRTWGAYHLLSFPEVRRLFLRAGACDVRPLPARGYFSFEGLSGGRLKPLAGAARAWVEGMPAAARGTPLDPFVVAEVLV